MTAFSTEYLGRRPYLSSVLLCLVLVVCCGFIYDYKYESVLWRPQVTSNPSIKHFKEVQQVELSLKKRKNSEREPLVFIYNNFFFIPDWYSYWDNVKGSKVTRTLKNCPTKCVFTTDPYLLKSADFVLVSLASYKHYGGKPVTITYPKGDQVWTAFLLEGPYYGVGYEDIDGIFDWVATYRRDSDVFLPYGRLEFIENHSHKNTSIEDVRALLKQKKLAAWLVSHCNTTSQREILVQTLQRYMPVDVFGKCSKNQCPETKKLNCRAYLGQNYKFYLSFENSLCVDYVTEKFFYAYQSNMVPVTFGWVDYSLYGPPGSYINALDYDSVEDLANYLLYLDKNDDEYLKYFEWKGKYEVKSLHIDDQNCLVCKGMSEYMKRKRENGTTEELLRQESQRKRYPSFRNWQESLPRGQSAALFQVGRKVGINSTKGCIDPLQHSNFRKWIEGY